MADYGDLTTIIGQMKRAAIDCWMADQDFFPTWGYEETYTKWHFAPYQYFRPAADGSGGGDGVGYDVSCADAFDGIRSSIDSIVSKWHGLPDGAGARAYADAGRITASLLGSNGAGSSVQNSGSISTSSGTIQDVVVGNMEGAFRRPFLSKYFTAFSSVQNGLGQAAVILAANYAAQQAMWGAVKADVATICDNARLAWEKQAAEESAANTTFQLQVVGAVVTAVAAVVTAPAGLTGAVAGLSATSAGISMALSEVARDGIDIGGESYEDILASLSDALDKLNATITTQEEILNDAMQEAIAAMTSDAQSYNLDAFQLGEYPLGDGSMRMDVTDAGIVSDNMRLVHEELAEAASTIGTGPASSPTPRSAGIGVAPTGTHATASQLHGLTSKYLQDTRDEYERGHRLFDATVADFFATDAAARQTVQQLLADEALTGQS